VITLGGYNPPLVQIEPYKRYKHTKSAKIATFDSTFADLMSTVAMDPEFENHRPPAAVVLGALG
jgi:hypothetical protein